MTIGECGVYKATVQKSIELKGKQALRQRMDKKEHLKINRG